MRIVCAADEAVAPGRALIRSMIGAALITPQARPSETCGRGGGPARPCPGAAHQPYRALHLVEIERLSDEPPRPELARAAIVVGCAGHQNHRNPRQRSIAELR